MRGLYQKNFFDPLFNSSGATPPIIILFVTIKNIMYVAIEDTNHCSCLFGFYEDNLQIEKGNFMSKNHNGSFLRII